MDQKSFIEGATPVSQLFRQLASEIESFADREEREFPLTPKVLRAFESQVYAGSLERDKLEKLLNLAYVLIGHRLASSSKADGSAILKEVNSFNLTRNDLVSELLRLREKFNAKEGLAFLDD